MILTRINIKRIAKVSSPFRAHSKTNAELPRGPRETPIAAVLAPLPAPVRRAVAHNRGRKCRHEPLFATQRQLEAS